MNWEKFYEKIEENPINLRKLENHWMTFGKVVETKKERLGLLVIIIPFLSKENAERLFNKIKWKK